MTKVKNNVKPKFVRRIITAIRDSTPVSPDFYVEPIVVKSVSEVKPEGNMYYVRKVLEESGRIELKEAIQKFLTVHKVESKNPELRVKTIFLQANQYKVPVKIEKVGKETFIELA